MQCTALVADRCRIAVVWMSLLFGIRTHVILFMIPKVLSNLNLRRPLKIDTKLQDAESNFSYLNYFHQFWVITNKINLFQIWLTIILWKASVHSSVKLVCATCLILWLFLSLLKFVQIFRKFWSKQLAFNSIAKCLTNFVENFHFQKSIFLK